MRAIIQSDHITSKFTRWYAVRAVWEGGPVFFSTKTGGGRVTNQKFSYIKREKGRNKKTQIPFLFLSKILNCVKTGKRGFFFTKTGFFQEYFLFTKTRKHGFFSHGIQGFDFKRKQGFFSARKKKREAWRKGEGKKLELS